MITNRFLHEVADFTNRHVSKVVLNGAYEITRFTLKQVEGNTFVINYIVPLGFVPTITQIELKDDEGHVVSDNAVYVPIASDTLMVQTIRVREGHNGEDGLAI